jgi:hypothetical protein
MFEANLVAKPDGTTFKGFCYPGSLVRLPNGKLMAVFTAQREPQPHSAVGVYSDDEGRSWSTPRVLFGGSALSDASIDLNEGYADPNVVVLDDRRVMVMCVSLRFKDGNYDLARTRFWRRTSENGGADFGPVEELPRHRKYIVGTIHPGIRLADGSLAMSYSWDKPAEVGRPADGEGTMDLVSGVLRSFDNGATWTPGGDLHADVTRGSEALSHSTNGVDEPAMVELPDGRLFMLMRTCSDRLWQSFSHDKGVTWEPAKPSPLVSHNCPAAMIRLIGGKMHNAVLVIYNHHPKQRARMSASVSVDGCRTWSTPHAFAPVGHLDAPEASYPAVCQLDEKSVLVVFGQIDREDRGAAFCIRSVRFDPEAVG